jgi:hypothetical protein
LPSTNKLSPDRRFCFPNATAVEHGLQWAHRPAATLSNAKGKRGSAFAVSERGVPTQLANESFRTSHVRFGNFVGAVAQVPMRGDFPAPEAFLYDHIVMPFWNGGEVRDAVSIGQAG